VALALTGVAYKRLFSRTPGVVLALGKPWREALFGRRAEAR